MLGVVECYLPSQQCTTVHVNVGIYAMPRGDWIENYHNPVRVMCFDMYSMFPPLTSIL